MHLTVTTKQRCTYLYTYIYIYTHICIDTCRFVHDAQVQSVHFVEKKRLKTETLHHCCEIAISTLLAE